MKKETKTKLNRYLLLHALIGYGANYSALETFLNATPQEIVTKLNEGFTKKELTKIYNILRKKEGDLV